MPLIGILGGTFDPIHNGHIRLALEARQQLNLNHVRLIPVNIPPHRSKPVASPIHRQAMLTLAIDSEKDLCIDLRELNSNETSYTINTLKSLRKEFKTDSFCLILGKDAFNKIDSWKDWETLLDYAHIVVANRPGEDANTTSPKLEQWLAQHKTNQAASLKEKPAGAIYFINIPMLDISSSNIRQSLSDNKTVDKLIPTTTLTYIKNNHLYQDTA